MKKLPVKYGAIFGFALIVSLFGISLSYALAQNMAVPMMQGKSGGQSPNVPSNWGTGGQKPTQKPAPNFAQGNIEDIHFVYRTDPAFHGRPEISFVYQGGSGSVICAIYDSADTFVRSVGGATSGGLNGQKIYCGWNRTPTAEGAVARNGMYRFKISEELPGVAYSRTPATRAPSSSNFRFIGQSDLFELDVSNPNIGRP